MSDTTFALNSQEMHIHQHTHTYTYIDTYINTHTYIDIDTYINTHTRTHTHTPIVGRRDHISGDTPSVFSNRF